MPKIMAILLSVIVYLLLDIEPQRRLRRGNTGQHRRIPQHLARCYRLASISGVRSRAAVVGLDC
jgi:hypothetical protein